MQLQTTTKRNLRSIAGITAFTVLCGIAYPLFTQPDNLHAIRNGIVIGVLMGLSVGCAELYFFGPIGRRLRFSSLLIVRSIFYVILISGVVVFVVAEHLTHMYPISLGEAFYNPKFQYFLFGGEFLGILVYALGVSFVINFVRQINRLLGQNALFYYITGKYHHPREEERIFMFLDLKSSTTIAEHLGAGKYHSFLNDFFFDITPAIVESKGHIYQYVGDEVVITWTRDKGLKDAECLKCYFRIAGAIHRTADRYMRSYGIVPAFKAGYHFGPVIAGEIGDIKRDVVFHGDTVNTASRIRSECTRVGKDVLISGELLQHIHIEDILTPETMGRIKLRGKEEEVELFTIREAA